LSDKNNPAIYPAVTVGVITHSKRLAAFEKLLSFLLPAIEHYRGQCELLVGNNSGTEHRQQIERSIEQSGLESVCSCRLVDSPENNIAVGRNCVIDNTNDDWLAFIDDDEFPTANWLNELCEVMLEFDVKLVAGPIVPVYESGTAKWIKSIDVHNMKGLSTGDSVPYAATGNFLMHLPSIKGARLNTAYGKTGGSDTEFFLRLTASETPLTMLWAEKAVVHEDIPAAKSTTRYVVKRSLSQGNNYKRVLSQAGKIKSPILFNLKAIAVTAVSLLVAVPLVLIGHATAGDWVKRGFSNMGKFYDPSGHLYK